MVSFGLFSYIDLYEMHGIDVLKILGF